MEELKAALVTLSKYLPRGIIQSRTDGEGDLILEISGTVITITVEGSIKNIQFIPSEAQVLDLRDKQR